MHPNHWQHSVPWAATPIRLSESSKGIIRHYEDSTSRFDELQTLELSVSQTRSCCHDGRVAKLSRLPIDPTASQLSKETCETSKKHSLCLHWDCSQTPRIMSNRNNKTTVEKFSKFLYLRGRHTLLFFLLLYHHALLLYFTHTIDLRTVTPVLSVTHFASGSAW